MKVSGLVYIVLLKLLAVSSLSVSEEQLFCSDSNNNEFEYLLSKIEPLVTCEDLRNEPNFGSSGEEITITKTVTFTWKAGSNIPLAGRFPCNDDYALPVIDLENFVYQLPDDPTLRKYGNCNRTETFEIPWDWYPYGNYLTDVHSDVFKDMPELKFVAINYQELQNVDFLKVELPHLVFLEFSYNQITLSPDFVFQRWEDLKDLNLPYNQISSLDAGLFPGLPGINHLWLDGNPITSIEAGFISEDFGKYNADGNDHTDSANIWLLGITAQAKDLVGSFTQTLAGQLHINGENLAGFDIGTFSTNIDNLISVNVPEATVIDCCNMQGISDFHPDAEVVLSYACAMKNGTVIQTQSREPLKEFDCCVGTENSLQFYDENTRLCSVCTAPKNCNLTSDSTTNAMCNSLGETVCTQCEENYFLDLDQNKCNQCQLQLGCKIHIYGTCIKETTLMQCFECLDPDVYQLSDQGLCEAILEDNSSSQKLVIGLSVGLSLFLILLLLIAVLFFYRRKKNENKKIFGVSLEEWLNDDGRQIELHTDEEYYANTGKHADNSAKNVDGKYQEVDNKKDDNYQGVDDYKGVCDYQGVDICESMVVVNNEIQVNEDSAKVDIMNKKQLENNQKCETEDSYDKPQIEEDPTSTIQITQCETEDPYHQPQTKGDIISTTTQNMQCETEDPYHKPQTREDLIGTTQNTQSETEDPYHMPQTREYVIGTTQNTQSETEDPYHLPQTREDLIGATQNTQSETEDPYHMPQTREDLIETTQNTQSEIEDPYHMPQTGEDHIDATENRQCEIEDPYHLLQTIEDHIGMTQSTQYETEYNTLNGDYDRPFQ